VLSSNGTATPTWLNQSALSVGFATTATNATNATTAVNFSGSLSGDVTGTQSATSVVKVNGASIPTTNTIVGTNGSGQIIDASASTATVALNTTGNAGTVTNGVYTPAFNNSLTTDGYQKIQGGLIIQWGTNTASTAGVTSSFPLAFPNRCFSMVAVNNNQTNPPAPSVTIVSASQFTLTVSAGSPTCYWTAIGY
jgi:hypothetical protein